MNGDVLLTDGVAYRSNGVCRLLDGMKCCAQDDEVSDVVYMGICTRPWAHLRCLAWKAYRPVNAQQVRENNENGRQ